jgi:archaellum component FlaC
MKCFVKSVGVIDRDNIIHQVTFKAGLNIITGKSSMGKSAIIEIFDFCFGNSDDTIPKGVITDRSKIYFTFLQFEKEQLLLARMRSVDKLFISEVNGTLDEIFLKMKNVREFFSPSLFLPLRDFKKELGRYFSVTMTDIDEDLSSREQGKSKSSTPSVRSFVSYMLQHQNLVANKHALFYRFDEKEKREQAIEHLKIFMNFADQKYFWLSQESNQLKAELKKIEAQIPKKKEEKEQFIKRVDQLLAEYKSVSGTDLIGLTGAQIAGSVKPSFKKIRDANVRIDSLTDTYSVRKKALEEERSKQTVIVRGLQDKVHAVQSSISLTEDFAKGITEIPVPEYAEIIDAHCPFCDAPSEQVDQEANKLTVAIDWMNRELRTSSYVRESFRDEENKLSKALAKEKDTLSGIQANINQLAKQVEDLKRSKTVDEIALRVKHRLEDVIEDYGSRGKSEFEATQQLIKERLAEIKPLLDEYDVPGKMADLSDLINSEMSRIGAGFDFEEAYQPINLKFDLHTFDLWHESPTMGNVYLRSMGSGANWLYTHLTLFLALHSVFALKHEEGCKIPPILFLDQPTQVYFPAKIDHREEGFDPKALAALTERAKHVDEDIGSVTNMFDKLVEFCEQTEKATGLMPQIIVTDHADELTLKGQATFQSFVRATWRTRGFIAKRPADAIA